MIYLFEPERGGKGSPCEFAATTAALIGLAIAGGSQVASSVMASNASHNAAKVQQTAAQQDLSLRQAVFNTQQQNLAPYRAIGLQGLAGASNMAAQPPSMDPSGNGWSTLRNPSMGPAGAPPVPNYGTYLNAQPGAPVPGAAPGTAPRVGAPIGTAVPRGQGTLANPGGMVTLQGPDGSIRQFPVGHPAIQKALAMGATQV